MLLVTRLLARSPFDYRLAADDCRARRRLPAARRASCVDRGWCTADELPGGTRARRVRRPRRPRPRVGRGRRDEHRPGGAAARICRPEEACGIVVEPPGEVVDVGRMCVAPSHQSLEHAAFIGLMCRLYLEMRTHGSEVACGMMSAPAPRPGGPARPAAGDPRPGAAVLERVAGTGAVQPDEQRGDADGSRAAGVCPSARPIRPAPRTSAVLAPPKPKEFDSASRAAHPARHALDHIEVDMPGSTVRSPATGGTRRCAGTSASRSPPPRRSRRSCGPVVPLTAVTGGHDPANSAARASASARSLSTVLVPCALTCATSLGRTPASARASSMQRSAPSPSGLGATRWWASAVEAWPSDEPEAGPARDRVRGALEHDESGALAHDEPVAVRRRRGATRARGARRCGSSRPAA